MLQKFAGVVILFVFAVFSAACPVGGVNNNDNDGGLPQNDANVNGNDAEVELCGNGTCDEAEGEDCDTCFRDCGGVLCSPVQPLTVQEYRTVYMEQTLGQTNVDLRAEAVCQAGRIPGETKCSQLSSWWDGSAITDGGSYLDAATASEWNPLIFYSWDAQEAIVLAVAEAAMALGYEDVFYIVGGMEAWEAEGWYEDISYEAIVSLYYPPGSGVLLIDTMDATHFEDCHIADATHLTADEIIYGGVLVNGGQALLDMSDPADDDVLIFFCVDAACKFSEEASEAAEELGYANIYHYKYGTKNWVCDYSAASVGAGCGAICNPP